MLKRVQKNGQSDWLKARKKPSFIYGIVIPCHRETYELQEYQKKFVSKLRVSLFWHCTEAHYWCFSDFSWFVTVRLHTWVQWCHSLHTDPPEPFCTYATVISITLVLRSRIIRLRRHHYPIYVVETKTCLQALSLLCACNTKHTVQCTHFQWLR